jgi:hypothetical protein
MALASACGSGRFKLFVNVPTQFPPGGQDRGKGCMMGQGMQGAMDRTIGGRS